MVWDSLNRGETSISYFTTGHDIHQHFKALNQYYIFSCYFYRKFTESPLYWLSS